VRKKTESNIIRTNADIARGMKALGRQCAHMKHAQGLVGMPPLRRRQGGFTGLARIVMGQQLSVASAAAITTRLMERVQPFDAENVLACSDEVLHGCGLSRPKIRTLRAVSEAVISGDVNFRSVARSTPEKVHEVLTAVKGIGPWTADIYIMFCMGHRDGFAVGDLALQKGAAELMGLKERPSGDELLQIAERWRPYRSVAARVLWAYYAHNRAQKNAMPT